MLYLFGIMELDLCSVELVYTCYTVLARMDDSPLFILFFK